MNTMSKNEWIGITIGTVLFLIIIGGISLASVSNTQQNQVISMSEESNKTQDTQKVIRSLQIADGVSADVLKEGKAGSEVNVGDAVSVHYTGTLITGEVFDSSQGRQPLSFNAGLGQMIPGFDAGVIGMKIGEIRRLTLSPEQAYGERGIQNPQTGEYVIPQNASLIFTVEMVSIQ
jgi:FKBP-type peptidyl-prolyl cis-trans isomerase